MGNIFNNEQKMNERKRRENIKKRKEELIKKCNIMLRDIGHYVPAAGYTAEELTQIVLGEEYL